jgi:hypothetical protein|tara:strand:- start:1875 stop:2036 length:162 start_codon:yes stop_codon:yes gene_type:complete
MKRVVWPAVGFVLLVLGCLVLLTDLELHIVRWFNCGPMATEGEKNSEVCRRLQ